MTAIIACPVAAIAHRFFASCAFRRSDQIRSMSRDEFCAANRRDWDERVAIHRRDTTEFYGVERFLARKTTARDRQRRARRDCLRRTAGGQRRIRRRVHDLGTICWLPDIVRWAETIASLFAPDGAFYFADAHPAMLVLEEREGRLVAKWAADTPIDEPLVFDEAQTYTGDPDAAHCVAHLPVDPFAAANSQGADGDRGSSSILFTSISGCPGRRFPCASGATTAPSTEGRACRAVGRITARHQARHRANLASCDCYIGCSSGAGWGNWWLPTVSNPSRGPG